MPASGHATSTTIALNPCKKIRALRVSSPLADELAASSAEHRSCFITVEVDLGPVTTSSSPRETSPSSGVQQHVAFEHRRTGLPTSAPRVVAAAVRVAEPTAQLRPHDRETTAIERRLLRDTPEMSQTFPAHYTAIKWRRVIAARTWRHPSRRERSGAREVFLSASCRAAGGAGQPSRFSPHPDRRSVGACFRRGWHRGRGKGAPHNEETTASSGASQPPADVG